MAATALAFDVYGTLVDPIRIWERLDRHFPPDVAVQIAEIWRRKQLELTFRLSVMGKYEDFEWCTRKGLDHALAEAGQTLDEDTKDVLIAQYNDLEPFPDAQPGLQLLREQGHDMAVLSNGTPHMLDDLLDRAGLRDYFDACISVDEVRVYKPSPVVYRHAAQRLDRQPEQVRLVSSNPFDAIGAEAAGLRAAWVDRTHGLFEPDGAPPDIVVGTLTELADALEKGGQQELRSSRDSG